MRIASRITNDTIKTANMEFVVQATLLVVTLLTHVSTSEAASPSAGGPGRAMYFSSHGEHKADIMTWRWKDPPTDDFTVEYWWREVDHHLYSHTILNYAAFDVDQSPIYDSGFELAIEQRYSYFFVS